MKNNLVAKFYNRLKETRWFYSFTASCAATIVGISLTLGVNSCSESRRARRVARESIVQAVDNLHTRSEQIDSYLRNISRQDSIYDVVADLYNSGATIPDSVADEFLNLIFSVQFNIADKGFEKIFLESYQLWQELDQNELTSMITSAYNMTDFLENFCQSHNNQMLQEIKQCGLEANFLDDEAAETTKQILSSKDYRFYMNTRSLHTKGMNVANEVHHDIIARIDSVCQTLNYVKKQEESTVVIKRQVTDSDSAEVEQ
jgi:hypothetical protein